MTRIGSEHVARLAGVSRSTVSRVFTPGTYVAEGTRQKVERAAAILGYRPNIIARSLTMKRTNMVGVVVGDLENPTYSAMVRRIVDSLQDRGLASLLFTARYTEVNRVIQSLMAYQVDALVVCSAVPAAPIAVECRKAGKPLILVNRQAPLDVALTVGGDNRAGTALIAQHFLEQDYHRIAFVAGIDAVSSSTEREQGLAAALQARGRVVSGRAVGDYTYEGAARATRALLSAAEPPDAIFCANDTMAVAALDIARDEFGLRPGRDIGIAGYDDAPMARLPAYDLTTVNQDLDSIVAAVVARVEAAARGEGGDPAPVLVPPRLVVRSSTRRS